MLNIQDQSQKEMEYILEYLWKKTKKRKQKRCDLLKTHKL